MKQYDKPIDRLWFERSTLSVARDLLGCILVHNSPDGMTSGRIVEVEAYCGPEDRGSHSYGGRMTHRNRAMFGPAGFAYIYRIYGMYWCFNITTDRPDHPHAILIRALEPVSGLNFMRERSPKINRDSDLCKGPGRLCRAMGITGDLYGVCVYDNTQGIYVEAGKLHPDETIASAPRIGIDYAGDHASLPWRLFIQGNRCVSRLP